jgi:hypothetical protein
VIFLWTPATLTLALFNHIISQIKSMPDILALLVCLNLEVDSTIYRQFGQLISAMLAMSGRITMKGISRWAGKGDS